jgi:hypothetical protein
MLQKVTSVFLSLTIFQNAFYFTKNLDGFRQVLRSSTEL